MEVSELRPGSTAEAFEAMRELRPHLVSVEDFVRTVDQVQRPQGYRLVVARESAAAPVVSVGGFRFLHSLSSGPFVYVDDLSTLPTARGRGGATALLGWIAAEASRLGCRSVQLDSGTQRLPAHRLYLGSGFDIRSFHFTRQLTRPV